MRATWWMAGAVLLLAGLSGCGGGGASNATVTGVITDIDGKAVAGADVSSGHTSTRSLSNGTFTLPGVKEGIQTIYASTTINGHKWSGVTSVDAVNEEQNRTINVVISDERYQGGVGGIVIDPNGYRVEGAKVFIGGPVASTMAVTDHDGNYEIDHLYGGATYTVTCSLAGYTNQTQTVHVSSGQVSAASFALAPGGSGTTLPAPQNVSAEAWTLAGSISRSAGDSAVYEALKSRVRKAHGHGNVHVATKIDGRGASRATPYGSVVEIDMFWDYAAYDKLLGYKVRRGVSSGALADVALLRDPLANVFFDVDPMLTPNQPYYYTVSRLDTVDFPDTGASGPSSQVVSANPLNPETALAPVGNARVSVTPTFQWAAVAGAATYQVFVWDRFPDLQNSSDPEGVTPVWPGDLNAPGGSLVNAPATSVTYSGPALTNGHTYYWMVVAQDAGFTAFSASQIGKFTVQ